MTTHETLNAKADRASDGSLFARLGADRGRLMGLIAQHVSTSDWAVATARSFERSTVRAEAGVIGVSPRSYRAALQRVVEVTETVWAVTETSGSEDRPTAMECVCPRFGIGDVLPWVQSSEVPVKQVANELRVPVRVVRERLSRARELVAIAEAVAAAEVRV